MADTMPSNIAQYPDGPLRGPRHDESDSVDNSESTIVPPDPENPAELELRPPQAIEDDFEDIPPDGGSSPFLRNMKLENLTSSRLRLGLCNVQFLHQWPYMGY